jgi:hypothetical protein
MAVMVDLSGLSEGDVISFEYHGGSTPIGGTRRTVEVIERNERYVLGTQEGEIKKFNVEKMSDVNIEHQKKSGHVDKRQVFVAARNEIIAKIAELNGDDLAAMYQGLVIGEDPEVQEVFFDSSSGEIVVRRDKPNAHIILGDESQFKVENSDGDILDLDLDNLTPEEMLEQLKSHLGK